MATHQSRDEPSFGALLRRHRLMGHLTQAALAARASLSQRGIADLERGLRQTPRADTVARLADGLGLTGHARSAFEASAARFAQTTRNPPPSNLPADGASFIGRERQLRQIRTALSVHGARLVSLTGPGGAGKTRIALRAADELLAQFPDGVFVVWLSEVNDAELVPAALAQALGLPERSDRPILRSVADFLRRKQLLLVIDNFEHLMPAAAAVVSQLLKSAANLNMLVTSRVRLNLSGEHVIQVPPMALPDQTAGTTAQALTQFESVRLFLDRARASQPDLELTDSNAWRIAEICRRLDGLPLSLELAAARLRVLSLESLQALLEQRLPLLTGGPRDTPARQQTMRNAVAWSYDLLGPGEQLLFRRLAVFHGGGLGAIERVCGEASATDGSTSIVIAPLGIDLLDGLAALVDNSLLLRNETPDGQPWFVMLEIIREYALERLLESAEAEAIRRRHALRCVELAESAGPTLTGRRQSVWIPVLERESANLRAALIWCQQRGYAEPAFRLAVSLWWFWVISGRAIEGRDRLTNLLARFPPRTHPARYALVRARAAQAAGNLCGFQADYPSARSFHEEAAQAFRQQGDEGSLHGALQALGWVASRQGEHAAALGYLQEALELVRKRGDPAATGAALFNLAYVKHELRDYAAAQELLEQSLALKADLGRSASMGLIHVMLGLVALDRGDTRRARELCELGLRLGRAAGDHRGIGVALVDFAAVAVSEGDYVAARDALAENVTIQRQLGDPLGLAIALERLGELIAGRHEAAIAMTFAAAAFALRESVGAEPGPDAAPTSDHWLSRARQRLGPAEARVAWNAGLSSSTEDLITAALAVPLMPDANAAQTARTTLEHLTRREREVAALVAQGFSNQRIAAELVISSATVASHVAHILNKLAFESRAQVAAWAAENRLLAQTG